jgi:glycosyltransferase involved in cell wall biosynthesis
MNLTICIPSIGRDRKIYTDLCKIIVGENYGNASQARLRLAQEAQTDWILYIDDDIYFDDSAWVEKMYALRSPDKMVFAKTTWTCAGVPNTGIGWPIDTQCMLVHKQHCDKWDKYLGTEAGMIGKDGESEDFTSTLIRMRIKSAWADTVAYHEAPYTFAEFDATDRAKLGKIYRELSLNKTGPEQYANVKSVPYNANNRNMLPDGVSFADILGDLYSDGMENRII